MASKIGNAAAAEARGVPEFDLLASGVDRENNSTSESTQAASSITVTVRGPAAPKGRPGFTRTGFVYSPAKTRKYEARRRLAAQLAPGAKPPFAGPVYLTASDLPAANWHEMSVGALWDRLNDLRRWPEAPQSTYDAALFELREYGITQLAKPNCQRRLAMLSPKQLEDVIAALLRLQPRYQTITDELIATLREIS